MPNGRPQSGGHLARRQAVSPRRCKAKSVPSERGFIMLHMAARLSPGTPQRRRGASNALKDAPLPRGNYCTRLATRTLSRSAKL